MPTYDPAFLDAIENLPTREWRGRVWRHMFNDYEPERINIGGARWNPPGVGAIYAALDRDTAIAEGDRMIEVQPRRFFRRRVLYELQVDADNIVDLTGPGALTAAGLSMTDVESDDHAACQRVGGSIAWLQRGGILVPSARNNGTNMVILIGPGGDAEIDRVGQETLFDSDRK
ncbi:RES family NAD+ phosphorylase [Rathayibacter sp. VKM Ac-2928]|uniref:RES family NAD+ phosphorylase n=1 Tax=Rathayibacter sp. VKM Ac-2928 TaxID=2929479 RepID=UPI001FB45DEC|nr:RES family NAD+ phosphorylase [Rathayibacter sp. VKM Ac-2928]MCJ1685340.1 RES family NAD+ phosphorylase [Rathayibacter sp. VKM Ac-2928]